MVVHRETGFLIVHSAQALEIFLRVPEFRQKEWLLIKWSGDVNEGTSGISSLRYARKW